MDLHVLAFPFPIPGHANSLMHLCRKLAPRLRITFLSTEDNYQAAIRTRDLVATSQSGLSERIRVVQLGSFPRLEDLLQLKTKMRSLMEEFIQKLQDDGDGVDCILCDTFTGWVQDVADKFNIPRAILWTSNAINDVLHWYLPELVDRGFAPVASCKDRHEAAIDFLPGIPPFPASDLPLAFHKKGPVMEVVIEGAKRFREAEFALCNTLEELEQHLVAVIRKEVKAKYYCVGPCLSPDFLLDDAARSEALSEEDVRCLDFLDEQPRASVVYVSFGSVAGISLEQAQELATGLENAGHPFLFVLRKNLVAGGEEFFDRFVQRTRGKGLVVSWAPQMQVLLHPAVGGFLTHCGWNSTFEAICGGVPLLAWPQAAEQNVNCKEIIEKWEIGIKVSVDGDGGVVSGETLAQLVHRLMSQAEGRPLRTRAQQLRDMARSAVLEGGSSDTNIRSFVDALESYVAANPKLKSS